MMKKGTYRAPGRRQRLRDGSHSRFKQLTKSRRDRCGIRCIGEKRAGSSDLAKFLDQEPAKGRRRPTTCASASSKRWLCSPGLRFAVIAAGRTAAESLDAFPADEGKHCKCGGGICPPPPE